MHLKLFSRLSKSPFFTAIVIASKSAETLALSMYLVNEYAVATRKNDIAPRKIIAIIPSNKPYYHHRPEAGYSDSHV